MAEWPPRDQAGLITPHRLKWISFFRAMPSLVARFGVEVPGEFFNADVDDAGHPVLVVACPCGEETRVPVSKCVECGCERFYLALGDRVLVANSPARS